MDNPPPGVALIASALLALGSIGVIAGGYTLLHLPPPPARPCVGMLCGFDWRPLIVPVAGCQIALSFWGFVTAVGLLARCEWARNSAQAIAWLPLGLGLLLTAHGGTLLVGLGVIGAGTPVTWYLGRPEVRTWFDRSSRQSSGSDVAS